MNDLKTLSHTTGTTNATWCSRRNTAVKLFIAGADAKSINFKTRNVGFFRFIYEENNLIRFAKFSPPLVSRGVFRYAV